jgi:opacity protein-like surface antigen
MLMPSQFKKTALLVAIGLSMPSCVLALPTNPSFNGFYVGAAAGDVLTTSKISANASSTYANYYDSANNLSSSQSNVHVYSNSFIGAAFLGYGQFIQDSGIYLAGEIFGNWANRSNTLNNYTYHTSPFDDEDSEYIATTTISKLRNSEFGIDFRPGFMMDTNTMLYGRLGLAFNRATLKSSNTFVFNDFRESTTYQTPFYKTKSHNQTAVRLGIGLERHVSESLSLTADYIYTYYGNVKTSVVGDTTTIVSGEDDATDPQINVNGFAANAKSTISTQALMFGIKFYFLQS